MIQVQIEQMRGYLAARFIGEGTLEEAIQQFELIAENCARTNNNKLLVDWTGAYGHASIAERYFMGERARIFAHYKLKVASVSRPEQQDSKLFGELVAQNRGVTTRTFTDTQSAEEWLLK